MLQIYVIPAKAGIQKYRKVLDIVDDFQSSNDQNSTNMQSAN